MKKRYFTAFGGVASLLITTLLLMGCKAKNEISPQRKDLQELVFASGVLEADDENNLTAQTDGYLVTLKFREGDAVKAGQVLAIIDNSQNRINALNAVALLGIAQKNSQTSAPAFQQIAANIESAKANLQLNKVLADRYQRLFASNSVSKLENENAQLAVTASQAQLDALLQQYENLKVNATQEEISSRNASEVNQVLIGQNQVKAIVSGKIYEKKKQLGDYVRKGDVIATIGDPSLIYARLNVDETSMAKIHDGLDVMIRLNTNKGKVYKATVHEILPAFDESTQSFILKAYFTDSLDFRIIGTQLEANILVGEKKNALVIPRRYLGYGNKVTLRKKGLTIVQTGIVSTDWAEITGGLTENDVLIENN
jgi:multidrug efflux pump subunit AcrA (membrane-fusion protein)